MKSEITFGSLFSKTVDDYKNNFKPIFLLSFWFIGIPQLILMIINILQAYSNETIREFVLNPNMINQGEFPWTYVITNAILLIPAILIALFVYASLTGVSLKKSRFTFAEAKKTGSSFYFSYLGFVIVSIIFLAGLFLLLIIPGIIFLVYWIFGAYVLYYEKKGVLASLKRSRQIVKGKWWKTFGYLILMALLTGAVMFVITLPVQMIQLIFTLGNIKMTFNYFILISLLRVISNFIAYLIATPFFILFFKNFYLELKKK